jgi:hypothetical protein
MTSTLTVRDLFVSSNGGAVGAGLRLPAVPDGLSQLVTGFEWNGLGERVFDLLDLNVVDILLGGWKTQQDVREQLRATAADPSRTVVVSLARHTIESSHIPSIELRAHGRALLQLSFPIELAFQIEAVELTLRAGDVREVRSGEVKVRGTVKLEGTVILERELSAIALPGRIVLGADAPPTPAGQAAPLSAAAV